MQPGMSSAGILIIGNEILTGKVQDENAPYLLRELREIGVDVKRVHVIPDEIDVISHEVQEFSRAFSYVLTTGGVGPTHDDVTMDGVAAAFQRRLVRDPRLEEKLHQALRGRPANESHLKMTMIPEGSDLIETPDLWFPLVRVENVYIFPGIPGLLKAKFDGARDQFVGRRVYLRSVYVTCIETDIAQDLREILAQYPKVEVGSYPKMSEAGYRTLITLECRDERYVNRATDALVGRIPADYLLRVE
jgi:molybdenum cofactor synthesis domain-containing protein